MYEKKNWFLKILLNIFLIFVKYKFDGVVKDAKFKDERGLDTVLGLY